MDGRLRRYDVVVVGGGAAGLAAAVAAAGRGARTALVERYGFLGGMATAGAVSTICGLYLTREAGHAEALNTGIPESFARRLAAMPGCDRAVRRGRTFVLPYSAFAFACLADELVTSVRDLDVYLHAYVAGVELGGARIEAVRVVTWERTIELAAAAVVEASGDAVVAAGAAAATETSPVPERQLASLVFVFQNVNTGDLGTGGRLALLRAVASAELEGRLPKGSSGLSLRPSSQPGEVICKLALDGIADGGGQRDWITAAEQEGRRRALCLGAFLRTLPPFSRSFISHTAAQVGVRESRRIIGRYELRREDVLAGRKFPDGVARASWPIELWSAGQCGATYEYLPDGETYDIRSALSTRRPGWRRSADAA